MRIPRIFVDRTIEAGKEFFLAGGALQHVSRVLRLRPDQHLILFDGQGGEWLAVIREMKKEHARLELLEHRAADRESPLRWELVQGISRGERMDYTLQKSVELGVTTIHPVMMKRTVVKLSAERASRRREHWQGVVRSAGEQSGRTHLPAVEEVLSLDSFLDRQPAGTLLLLDPQAEHGMNELPVERPERVLLVAGPEGGLDPSERKMIHDAGGVGVRMGPRILRTETAAVVAAALLLARWGDL